MSSTLAPVLDQVDSTLDESLERLFELVRIPSISTDPAFADDVAAAADWAVRDLASIGFTASLRTTPGHPMVVAHWQGPVDREAPHVLFYGHYDVQPVDPIELWQRPPFEPAIESHADGSRILLGRGTADDKGQFLTFVEACRAHVAVTGKLPIRVSVFLEGEEESGSPSLSAFLDENHDELACDLALVCDTNMWDKATPAITATLRGLVGEEVTVRCANRDLHSGLYGGPALNPIRVISGILADLHDANGAVTLPGFYEGVQEPPADVRSAWDDIGLTAADFLGPVGLSQPAGEMDRTVLEQLWTRPTAEINGIVGGYAGDGFKTVLPATVTAKVSFRLVAGQDPLAVRDAFRAFVTQRLPKDAHAEFKSHGAGPGLAVSFDSPALRTAQAALTEEWGRRALIIGGGGSIPVVGNFKRQLGMDSVMVGFGLDDDRIHSPNEKYDLNSFHKGIRSWARILAAL
ncbi:MAG: M20/M25/M40 family metallo-hydrolase [Ancalomicrobiaceae bacterium]|nr:M20/M25/M40 family metallo-hydrolase [Ancalomicrobiaceae bacterium]